jgi:hypothetical protein
MVPENGWDEEFFASLLALDEQLSRQVAERGCPYCGGPLHRANYERKPRGGLWGLAGEGSTLRHSLCCGRAGCRRRVLPPSLRYFGRRVYLQVVVLFASAAAQAAGKLRQARLCTGVPEQTLRRWLRWWRSCAVTTGAWTLLRARFAAPPPDESGLPRSLLERLEWTLAQRLGIAPTLSQLGRYAAGFASLWTLPPGVDGAGLLGVVTGAASGSDFTQKMKLWPEFRLA